MIIPTIFTSLDTSFALIINRFYKRTTRESEDPAGGEDFDGTTVKSIAVQIIMTFVASSIFHPTFQSSQHVSQLAQA